MIEQAVHVASSDADFKQLDALIVAYEEDLPADLRHSDAGDVRANLAEIFRSPNVALLACDGHNGCGCVFLTSLDSTSAVVTKMFVQTAYRGRGLARALMEALIEAARGSGFTRIVLDTDREQLNAAYQLYRSLGFTDCEPYGEVDYETPTFMELRL